ncbi:MAG TPA: AMP-binding protein [Actinophytocola sp.]|uniref:phenylacetate--CoA ligase family protein n=1 Tax=Actinophytocola sp. TaxID=1872138 RepID=UPI002DF9CA85|nr:AMP-binding protein [Actinophytocola sp.]
MLADRIAQYVHGLDAAVAATVSEAAARVPAFADRLAAADIKEVREVADLDRLPVLGKDELIAAQQAAPPFGGAVAPNARLRKVFASPGPLFEPQLTGTDPWHWAEALRAAGFGPQDVVLNCFSYHLSPAGAMFEEGALALGATVIPAGVGNQELQIKTAVRVGASAYTGLPSYLKALLDKATTLGEPLAIRRALVTAEPLPDSLRDWLASYVDTVHQAYGTAETGLLGYETAPNSGLALPDGVLVQICDPATGTPVVDDSIGQVVVTLLRPEQPLARFGTGDLSAWRLGADSSLRLAGVLGRIGEAVKVRGMFLHPRQAAQALATEPGIAAYRFIIDRVEHRDTLRCELVPAPDADADLADRIRDKIRSQLRLTADVVCVPALDDGPVLDDRRTW